MVPTGQRLVVGSYLSPVLESGEGHEVTSREVTFSALQLLPEFMRWPQIANASLGLSFVINHPSQFSIWVAVL